MENKEMIKKEIHPLNNCLKRISHYIDKATSAENENLLSYFHNEMISVFLFMGIEQSDEGDFVYKSIHHYNEIQSLQEQLTEAKKETDLFKGKWAISDALGKHSYDQIKESQDRLAKANDSIKLILTEFDCEDGLTFQGDKVYKILSELLATLKGD